MNEVSIRPKHYLTCLWPGMAELWWRGRFSALPAAVAFAAVINALLVAKFIYSDWLSGGLVWLACWVVMAAWAVLTVRSIRELPLLLTPRLASEEPDVFPDAQLAYLKGDYAAAETLLNQTLAVEPRDPPALLMLAAVYRHTSRLQTASTLLAEIRKLEVADKWQLEFQAEKARLVRDAEPDEEQPDPDEPDPDEPDPDEPDPEQADPNEGEFKVDSDLEHSEIAHDRMRLASNDHV